MAKRVLGNDPFLRGAAVRDPDVPRTAAVEPAATPASPEGTVVPGTEGPATETPSGPRATRRKELPLPPPKKLPRERPRAPTRAATPPRAGPAIPETGRQAKPSADADVDTARPSRHGSFDTGHLAGDGGLLPADLAAAAPTPRVVAVPPLPERAPPPANFVAITRTPPPMGIDAARGLIALLRRLARLDATLPSLEVDDFGRDPAFEAKVRPLLGWMYRRYFRVDEHGLDKLPRAGPLILVANRAGAIPWDAAMVNVAAARHGREVRPLIEDAVFHFPFLGVLVNRLGAVRACPENAERILAAGGAVTVFPEGAGGFAKPYRDRYRLQRFGRGGFVRLALRTGATIVPVAVVGSEETYPLLGRVPAKLLGFPFFPITPTWPWLGAAGLWPLPSKWAIELGDPVDLSGLGPAITDGKVMRIADSVRSTIQAMLDARLAGRTAVFADGSRDHLPR